MEENSTYQGLCSTCMDCETCMFLRNADKPVLQCEEFKSCVSVRCHTVPKKENLPTREDSIGMLNEPSGLMGLCVNCDVRFECNFCKQEGGVWHCEEYQ